MIQLLIPLSVIGNGVFWAIYSKSYIDFLCKVSLTVAVPVTVIALLFLILLAISTEEKPDNLKPEDPPIAPKAQQMKETLKFAYYTISGGVFLSVLLGSPLYFVIQ